MYRPSKFVRLIFLTLSIIYFIVIFTPFYDIITITSNDKIIKYSRKSIIATYEIEEPNYSGTVTYVDDNYINALRPKENLVTSNVYSTVIDSKNIYIISSFNEEKFGKIIKASDLYFFVGAYSDYDIIDAPEQMISSEYILEMLDRNEGTIKFFRHLSITIILLLLVDYIYYKRKQTFGDYEVKKDEEDELPTL